MVVAIARRVTRDMIAATAVDAAAMAPIPTVDAVAMMGAVAIAPMMAMTNITATAAMMNMSGEMAMIGPAVPDSHRRSFPE